jgi:phenylpropionate dioxygenase-like ring-hydroxylating dioxygenase large terminal subunit
MTVHEHAADPPMDLASSLDQGFTLPARWYTGSDVFEVEQRQIFGASWQFAGLAEQLSRPGDFLTCRAGPVPLVVVRGEDGELRAFANVCRRRGSELIGDSAGNRKSLQCHYHAWTYGLDGDCTMVTHSAGTRYPRGGGLSRGYVRRIRVLSANSRGHRRTKSVDHERVSTRWLAWAG